MKIHTTDGLFEISAAGFQAEVVTAAWACDIMADKPLMGLGGHLHRVTDIERRVVGDRIPWYEVIDPDGEYFFVRAQPVDA